MGAESELPLPHCTHREGQTASGISTELPASLQGCRGIAPALRRRKCHFNTCPLARGVQAGSQGGVLPAGKGNPNLTACLSASSAAKYPPVLWGSQTAGSRGQTRGIPCLSRAAWVSDLPTVLLLGRTVGTVSRGWNYFLADVASWGAGTGIGWSCLCPVREGKAMQGEKDVSEQGVAAGGGISFRKFSQSTVYGPWIFV